MCHWIMLHEVRSEKQIKKSVSKNQNAQSVTSTILSEHALMDIVVYVLDKFPRGR